MKAEDVKQILLNSLDLNDVFVQTEDESHFQIIAVGEIFTTLSRVKKQQYITMPLMQYIASNQIHAISIKTYTPDEWQRDRKLAGL